MSLQGKLLWVLQEREFERVGGKDTIKTGVRVSTARKEEFMGNFITFPLGLEY